MDAEEDGCELCIGGSSTSNTTSSGGAAGDCCIALSHSCGLKCLNRQEEL